MLLSICETIVMLLPGKDILVHTSSIVLPTI